MASLTMLDAPPELTARFPFTIPVRCVCCGGRVEMISPEKVSCTVCGATHRKMANEVERLKAVSSPEQSDLFRAAAKLIPLSPHDGSHWEELKGPVRKELIQAVRTVLKALKEKR